jgi:hypothetical protein
LFSCTLAIVDSQSALTTLDFDDWLSPCVLAEVVEGVLDDVCYACEDLLQVNVLEILTGFLVSRLIARLTCLTAVAVFVGIRLAGAASAVGWIATDDTSWLKFRRHGFDCRDGVAEDT